MQAEKSTRIDLAVGPKTLVELLRWRAEQQSGKVAYTYLLDGESQEVTLTYGELDLQAQAIAEALLDQGLRGQRALLLYPPGIDFIAGFFGCLYAGMIAIPAYPPDPARLKRTLNRLAVIAADAETKVALTTQAVLSRLEEMFAQAPMLEPLAWVASDTAGRRSVDRRLDFDASGDDIAFLQYTSGSTGKPKGVMLTHSNLIHNASIIRTFFEHGSEDKYVSWLPTFHDMGFMSGVLQPLYSGIPAVLLSPVAFLQSPFRWLKAITRYKATTSGGPNFAYDLCVRKISEQERMSIDLSSWTIAFNGAEPVRGETLDRFARTFEPCGFRREALYPCYGLAEATLLVAGGRKGERTIVKSFDTSTVAKGQVAEEKSSGQSPHLLASCGRASQDQRLVIVHPDTARECSPGEVGEVWVCGPSVGQGYWKKPAETEQTFRAYIADTGEGPFLRTGDLGFIRDDELFIAGRLKDLIIIRGGNHYPQDIELTVEQSHSALRPGCGAAFSVEIGGEERLVVVQEVDDRKPLDMDEIIRAIRQSVAESHELQLYAAILIRPGTISKTSSGKIQRSACRKEFLEDKLDQLHRSILEDCYSSPPVESFIRKALLAIDSKLRPPVAESYILDQIVRVLRLSPSQVLPDQPLSALGLDSLMAIELKSQIEAQLGISISVSKLLAGCSTRQLTSLVLDGLDDSAPQLTALNGGAEARPTEYPLSYTQRALWFFHQLAPASAAYNIAFAVRIGSYVDADALEAAFQGLVDRHPCLRTAFAIRDGQPVQRIHQYLQAQIRRVPASALTHEELIQAVTDEAYRPFDLERDTVYRLSLFTRSAQEHILLLAVHHIVIDGWSFWVLLDELVDLYKSKTTGQQQLLPPSAIQYSDYIRWQAELLEGEAGESLFEYWRQELSGDLPVLNLPTSRPRPSVQTYSGSSYGFRVSEQVVSRLKQLAASADATLYMVLLAAFQVLLHRYSGQDDILVGSPISARSRAEFEGVVGCFFNAVVLRADFSSDLTFEQFLRQVRAKVLGAIDHQDYPSHLLVERLQPVRDPSRPPLFQATFILQRSQRQGQVNIAFEEAGLPAEAPELALSLVHIERRHARMELELEMIEADRAIYGWLHYNKDLFEAAVIARMANHFQVLLEGAIANPAERLSELTLLTAEEVQYLLAEQSPEPDSCKYSGVEELFLEQVKSTPEKVGAVYSDSCLSFGELNEQSDRLANLIRSLMK
jgi:acyl-CoA synthetase (AMP-forming)/AMP-acid ligase II/acyl carrier protein